MAKLYEFVTATLTVNFGDSAGSTGGASIKLEVDDREDGYNGGETSFKPGDKVGILQFVDANVTLQPGYPQASAGGVSPAGISGLKEIDENITFTNSSTANLGYPPAGGVTFKWMGRVVKLNKQTGDVTPYSGGFPDVTYSALELPDGVDVIGVLNAKYTADGTCHVLTVDKQTAIDFGEVLVFSIGQVTATV